MQHAFLSFFAVVLHDCNAPLYYYNVKLPSYTLFVWRNLSYVLTQYFVSCVHVGFYFSLALIYFVVFLQFRHRVSCRVHTVALLDR